MLDYIKGAEVPQTDEYVIYERINGITYPVGKQCTSDVLLSAFGKLDASGKLEKNNRVVFTGDFPAGGTFYPLLEADGMSTR